jgi:hypothetical protein
MTELQQTYSVIFLLLMNNPMKYLNTFVQKFSYETKTYKINNL